MITFPNAKINIGLWITGKRIDGYHNLESIFYPVPLEDSLEVLPSQEFTFHPFGNPIPGDKKNNLIYKAYELIRERYIIPPVDVAIIKNIPAGGGLGGGSSNGSFMLKILNDLFSLAIEDSMLEKMAAELGSDCPFFIRNKPIFVTGRGEKLKPTPLDLTGYYISLANPGIHISTAEAFGMITPRERINSLEDLVLQPVEQWKDLIYNDFEKPVFEKYPEIKNIRDTYYEKGALFSSMTGSGSTIYGIFSEKPELTIPGEVVKKIK